MGKPKTKLKKLPSLPKFLTKLNIDSPKLTKREITTIQPKSGIMPIIYKVITGNKLNYVNFSI